MVIAADEEAGTRREPVGVAEKRASLSTWRSAASHSRLHNFSFPSLSWGNQKLLRCVNLPTGSTVEDLEPAMRRSSSFSFDETRQASPSPSRPPPSRIRGQKRRMDGEEAAESIPAVVNSLKPWNLRTRRAACNAPVEIRRNSNPSSSSSPSPSPFLPPLQEKIVNPVRVLRSKMEGFAKAERRKFSIPLSRVEIEEDFFAMKGTKPPRRPKKRARYLQRQLDNLFPGSMLIEVTSDLYKIDEKGS